MTNPTEHRHDLFISYAEADRAWVEGYLLDALQAAGVRVHSEEAFRLGVPRLLEFEQAIQHSERVLLVLSPAYLCDEFSQFVNLLAQSYGLETATWPVIPLILQPLDLPPRLAMLQALDATAQENWAEAVETLLRDLRRPLPPPPERPACPFPGMVPFRPGDARFFCGREEEIEELWQRLRHQNYLFVIGPSGSGKSSLVRAGLVPRLHERQPDHWLVRQMRPGHAPLATLGQILGLQVVPATVAEPQAWQEVVDRLLARRAPRQRLLLIVDQLEELFVQAPKEEQTTFLAAIRSLRGVPNCTLVLALRADFYPDLMMSELWPVAAAERLEIAPLRGDALRDAIAQPAKLQGVHLEAGLLERLLADAAEEPGVLPLVQETMVLLWGQMVRRLLPLSAYRRLGGPGRSGLAAAVATKADATLAGLSAEQQGVARRVFLRLVQFVEGRADTRRQQRIEDLGAAGQDPLLLNQTLAHLAANRLLTLGSKEDTGERTVDIAHEVLIEGWPTLHGWVAQRREAEQTRRRLEAKAQEWVRLGQRSAGLLDEVELLEAGRWLASMDAADLGYSRDLASLARVSREAIETARREQETKLQRELDSARILADEQRRRAEAEQKRAEEQARSSRRLRRLAVGLAVVVLVAAMAACMAAMATNRAMLLQQAAEEAYEGLSTSVPGRETAEVRAQNNAATAEAERNRAEAHLIIATSRQLAAQSLAHQDDRLDLALLLGLEALRLDDNLEARSSLLTVLQYAPSLKGILRGHTSSIRSVAFSPDGQTLASSGDDRRIILWDVATRQPAAMPFSADSASFRRMVFSPDGQVLASAGYDGVIILWDVMTGQPLDSPLTGHSGQVWGLAMSPDGRTLASGGFDQTINLWDLTTRQPVGNPLTGHTHYVTSLAFSPDGRRLASSSLDETVLLWDVATGQTLGAPLQHSDSVWDVAFSPDGETLASASKGAVMLWDVAAGRPSAELSVGPMAVVQSVAFSPDGGTLASGSTDGSAILWDVGTHRPLGNTLRGHNESVVSLAFSPDGEMLATGSWDKTVALWDVSAPQTLGQHLIGHEDRVWSTALSPDGRMLVSGDEGGTIILWDFVARQPLEQHRIEGVSWPARAAIDPDGTVAAFGNRDGSIIIWDVASRRQLTQPLVDHADAVESLAFSPDGQILASGSQDRSIILWDIATGQPISDRLIGHSDLVSSLAFSPDGQTLASGSADNSIQLWEVATGRPIGSPLSGHVSTVWSVAFGPDGHELATGDEDGNILLWDVATQQRSAHLITEHDYGVQGLAFSPDGQFLVSAGGSTVMLWDVAARQPIGQPFTGHEDGAFCVTFSPDGRELVSGDWAGKIIVWDLSLEAWIERACVVANRNLTQDEWEQFVGPEAAYQCTCPNLPPGAGAPADACQEGN